MSQNKKYINRNSHKVTDLQLNDNWLPYASYKDGVFLDKSKEDIPIDEILIFYRDFVDTKSPIINPRLIHIFNHRKLNLIGEEEYSISQKWFSEKQDKDVVQLRKNLQNLFINIIPNTSKQLSYLKAWTTYKNCKHSIKGNGYTKQFISMWCADIKHFTPAIYLAYAANNYLPVGSKSMGMTNDQYALSMLINFISRSGIRAGEDIQIYIPSLRMRRLLQQWISEHSV